MTTEAAAPRPPGGLEIVRRIGVGGMGEVYEAVRLMPGGVRKRVAIKRLGMDRAPSDDARARFLREARISALLDHPNIVRVYDFLLDEEDVPILVMELLRGKTLFSLVKEQPDRRVPGWVALSIADQVLAGLDYAHKLTDEHGVPLGMVHRDITPANIFICDDGLVKLLDFGLARTAAVALTQTHQIHGTLEYLPPERWRGEDAEPRSDLYQLGASLYFALTGAAPHGGSGFDAMRARALRGEHPPLKKTYDVSAATVALVERALRVELAERFGDAADMRAAVVESIRSDYASVVEPLARWIQLEVSDTAIHPSQDEAPKTEPSRGAALATTATPEAQGGAAAAEFHTGTLNYGLPPRFQVRGVIAAGGMGVVLDAHDKTLDRDVAVKLISRDRRGDPEMRARLLREARLAATLRHPRIVAVYDVDPEGRFIVMERMHGETLAQRIRDHGKLAVAEVRYVGRALLDALAEAHSRGIVHRDVKPSNILFDEDGEPHLADFGVARAEDSDLTHEGARVGTPAYMAPEQLRANVVDGRADLYAVGATLYEAATGRRLHEGGNRDPNPLETVLEATGDEFLACAIAAAVEDRRSDRFADAQSFIQALEGTMPAGRERLQRSASDAPKRGEPTERQPVHRRSRPPEPRVAWRWVVAAVFVALVVVLVSFAVEWVTTSDVSAHPGASGVASTTTRGSPSPTQSAQASADAQHMIACLPFELHTTRTDLDYARTSLPHILGQRLSHDSTGTVLGIHRIAERVPQPDAPAAEWVNAAIAMGATSLLHGSITDAPEGKVQLRVWLTDRAGHETFSTTRIAKPDEVVQAIDSTTPYVQYAITVSGVAAQRRAGAEGTASLTREALSKLHAQSFADAEGNLRAAIDANPHDLDARYYYVITGWWSSKPPAEIEQRIREAEQAGVDPERVQVLRGLQMIEMNRFPAATQHFEALARGASVPSLEVLYGQFEALFHGGYPAEAIRVYQRLVARQPSFSLGSIHPMTYFIARGDAEGMRWSLDLVRAHGEASARAWKMRTAIGQRRYDQALQEAEDTSETAPNLNFQDVLFREMAWIHMLRGRVPVARAIVTAGNDPNEPWRARAELALLLAAGDDAGRTVAFSRALHQSRGDEHDPHASVQSRIEMATLVLASSQRSELAAAAASVDEIADLDTPRPMNTEVALALVWGAAQERTKLATLRQSPYPEAAAIVRAFELEAQHKPREAAAQWRAAVDTSGDGRHHVLEHYFAARAYREAGDLASMREECGEVLQPRVVQWSWPLPARACRAWIAN